MEHIGEAVDEHTHGMDLWKCSNQKMTNDFMAASIGTNPVIVRKILQQLKAAGLIEVARGTGGVTITRPLDQITFLDVYRAVECTPDEELFHFHENPNQK